MITSTKPFLSQTALALICLAAPLAPLASAAQDAAPTQEPVQLDTVVISGGFSPIAADAYGRAYSVVEGEDLWMRSVPSLRYALNGLPGVSMTETGASFSTIRMRGAPGNHTLVLIDGIEARGGGEEYALSGFGATQIERIEVLRGPQSVFYGSRASAGVVNIITRQAEGSGQSGSVSLAAGDGYEAGIFAAARSERGGVSLDYSLRKDEGYDASGHHGEKDGSHRRALSLRGDWQATDSLRFGVIQNLARETYDYDETDYMASDEQSYGVDTRGLTSKRDERAGQIFAEFEALDGRLTQRLSYDRSRYEQEFPGEFPYTMRGVTRALKYRAGYALDGRPVAEARQLINLMVERTTWQEGSSTSPTKEKRTNSVALEYRGFFENGLDLQAGIRRDDNRGFRDFTSWNLGLSKELGQGYRLHASAGAGMANPTFTELYGYPGWSVGNPDLAPEVNRSLDLGIEKEFADGAGKVDVTIFREKLTDMIASGSCATGTCSVNISGDTIRRGVEVSGDWQASDRIGLRGSYTYLDIDQPDGKHATYLPRHELTLGGSYRFDATTVGADLRQVAGLYAPQGWNGYEPAKLPDFTTVDLWAEHRLNDRVTFTGRVGNLFDADTQEAWGYGWRGRTAQIGVRADW